MEARKSLNVSIEKLKKEVIEMAELSFENIKGAFSAFKNASHSEASKILKLDDAVDEAEEAIAKHALRVIWKEQPVATDLRIVTAILKMITDIERIGKVIMSKYCTCFSIFSRRHQTLMGKLRI